MVTFSVNMFCCFYKHICEFNAKVYCFDRARNVFAKGIYCLHLPYNSPQHTSSQRGRNFAFTMINSHMISKSRAQIESFTMYYLPLSIFLVSKYASGNLIDNNAI